MIKGKVHKFGDNINTDDIIAATYLDSQDEKFLGSKCMENVDRDFINRVRPGDIMVAGSNFGCGSSREHAPVSLRGCGIAVVIAKSFARIFYRNSINVGMPILLCEKADELNAGDQLDVDLGNGVIKNINTGKVYACEKFPGFMEEIMEAKGLLNWIKGKKSA
jgi:3-isopropylmalate/(R)-2-methylmalate dehydratase small subunit